MQLGYCTNVHAGRDLETTRANLAEHAVAVKSRFAPQQPMGIGLWLSAASVRTLMLGDSLLEFRDWLRNEGLVPFTFNGFPYGDFHQPVVKHRVYEPTWADTERLEFTHLLCDGMDRLLEPKRRGSISTLPLGWGSYRNDSVFLNQCAKHLRRVAEELDAIESQTGRRIMVCLEPEPGCCLDTAQDVAQFFTEYLLTGETVQDKRTRRYLGVCHDICHSAVMRESQAEALRCYDAHGIEIGKVQVSAAIHATLDSVNEPESTEAAWAQLQSFAEDRYLHQATVARATDEGTVTTFYEDLPPALADRAEDPYASDWRIHFHVPIYRQHLGWIQSTQQEIREFLAALADSQQTVEHFEVETYAWNVLPIEYQVDCLADGIAQELDWFRALYSSTFNPKVK